MLSKNRKHKADTQFCKNKYLNNLMNGEQKNNVNVLYTLRPRLRVFCSFNYIFMRTAPEKRSHCNELAETKSQNGYQNGILNAFALFPQRVFRGCADGGTMDETTIHSAVFHIRRRAVNGDFGVALSLFGAETSLLDGWALSTLSTTNDVT